MKKFFSQIAALGFLVFSVSAQTATLVTTLANPAPAANEFFGVPIAFLGNDRILAGVPRDDAEGADSGAAYLFGTNGVLLKTFTNPGPALGASFGHSMAGLGTDRVIVGASLASEGGFRTGAAYLFTTNGALLTTFTNPTLRPNQLFGRTALAIGTDRLVVGAPVANVGPFPNAIGAAYIFATNGALLTAITNPMLTGAGFSMAAASLGNDRLVFGAPNNAGAESGGMVYLFNTNGALLTTFTNPTPAMGESFGVAVAAMGTDRVLVGAENAEAGADRAGTAYLFSADGTLLTTYTNPSPVSLAYFGSAVAALGDRILIGGRRNDAAEVASGAVYLFDTNGVLLTTITNPTPAIGDQFGASISTLDDTHAIIGAIGENTGIQGSGGAFLFRFQPVLGPRLSIWRANSNSIVVAWPSPSGGFTLQQNSDLVTMNWVSATDEIQDDGTNRSVTISLPASNRIHRLIKP